MAKLYRDKMCEYAYVDVITTRLNVASDTKTYYHRISIMYVLYEADKIFIAKKIITKQINIGETMDTIKSGNERIQAALPGFIAEDKLNLSGYQEA